MKRERAKFTEQETRVGYQEDSPYRCDCNQHVKVAKGETANGQLWVGLQCQRCGKKGRRSAKLYSREEIARMRLVDDSISERFYAAAAEEQQRALQEEKDIRNRQWWEAYESYLKTPQWQERRAKVLRRAGYVCEACLEKKATETHHTTYRHLGNEPLFELRAVCRECHESITAMDRQARGVE